jgi:hypothetical protein
VCVCVCACVCVCVCVCVRVRVRVRARAISQSLFLINRPAHRVVVVRSAHVPCTRDDMLLPDILRRHTGETGRLIKRTAKGAQVLFEGGAVAWIPTKGFTQHAPDMVPTPNPSWGTTDMADVLVLVFSHLTQREVARASEVCKRWRIAALSPTLWRDWDFYEVTALNMRWVQRRFLSYGLFMKARGARARSLRLFFRGGKNDYGKPCLGPFAPLSNVQADAKTLLWHLNHFFEGIDCTELRTVLLGILELIGPLSEITPIVRGAGSVRTLKLYTFNPKSMGDVTKLEFTNLRSLHVTSGAYDGGFGNEVMTGHGAPSECVDADLNRMLAACPRLRELCLFERVPNKDSPPFTLVSESVEELKLEGKGLHGLRALDMPALRHFASDLDTDFGYGALHSGHSGKCSYNMLKPLKNLKTATVGDAVFKFPASRGVCSTRTTGGGFVPSVRLCRCDECSAVGGDGAGAAQ